MDLHSRHAPPERLLEALRRDAAIHHAPTLVDDPRHVARCPQDRDVAPREDPVLVDGTQHVGLPHEDPVASGDSAQVVPATVQTRLPAPQDPRRQGRPADVPAAVAPGNPRRTPGPVGNPHPAVRLLVYPSPIVERRPAPGPVRHPRPAVVVRVDPVTVTVWPPARRHVRRRPHPAVDPAAIPRAVGSQPLVEEADGHLPRRRGRRRDVLGLPRANHDPLPATGRPEHSRSRA